jgi:hypothetical protein
MNHFLLLIIFVFSLSAKTLTPNDVYAQSALIKEHLNFLLKYYNIKHNHEEIVKTTLLNAPVLPRNTWQKSFEILVKINLLRVKHNYARIEPIGMEPVINLNPSMVYGMTRRVLVELEIYERREQIRVPNFTLKKFYNKTPLDVFNSLSYISASFDELNKMQLSPSFIFSESMRIYDDLTIILRHLEIQDNTIPTKRIKNGTLKDVESVSMKILDKVQSLQRSVGIETVELPLIKRESSLRDIYTFIGMILAELQPIKAYIGLTKSVTPPGLTYKRKTLIDVEQLMQWNLRKISLINKLDRR